MFCRYCKLPMPGTAAKTRYCTRCHHWQFPFAFLIPRFSFQDIALYGSVIVVLFSTFNIALFGRKADLLVFPLSCERNTASVYVANKGTHVGIMTDAEIQAKENEATSNRLPLSIKVDEKATQAHLIGIDDDVVILVELAREHRTLLEEARVLDGAPKNTVNVNSKECSVSIFFRAIVDKSETVKSLESRNACTCSQFAKSV